MSINALPIGRTWGKLKIGEGLAERAITVLLTLGFVALLTLAYARIAGTAPINSDHASILLEADDVFHGNILLHGWILTAITFYTTDLPFYVLGIALRGFSPDLLREVPAVIYALTVTAAMTLAGRGLCAERRGLARWTAFTLIGLPSLLVPEIVLVGVNHVGTALFMVLTLLALDSPKGRTLFGLLLALTIFGDSMAVVLLLLPIGMVSVARIWKDRTCWPEERAVLIPTMAAFLVSRFTIALFRLAGGFQSGDPAMKLTYLETLPRNVIVTVKSLLELFRANLFGKEVGLETAGMAVGLLGLGFVLYSLRLGIIPWRRGEIGGDRITEILTVAMLLNLIAYLLDYNVVYYMNTLYSPPERYLVPFFVLGAILAGRLGVAQVPDLRRFRLGLAALTIAYTGFFAQQLLTPPAELPAALMGRWLLSRGLTYGYGNFWCSNIITGVTGGQVKVRAVSAEGDTRLGQMYWFSKYAWYRGTPAHFLVFAPSHYGGRAFYWKDVNMAAARRTFGEPDETRQFGENTILIWKKDITPLLTHGGVK